MAYTSDMDRSDYPVRKTQLANADDADMDYVALTPSDRLALVAELTRAAWAFRTGRTNEPRLARDVGRVIRRGS